MLALAETGEELVHAAGHALGAVDGEGEFRDVADAHALAELGADPGAGGHEAVQGRGFLGFATVDGDKDAGGFAAGGENDVGDVAGGDAWVAEFAFQHGADLFGEGVGDTVAMVISCSMFRHALFRGNS